MRVAVAIVGFRNADDIVRCVAALETSTHDDFEVVICENGGAEAHRALSDALPGRLNGGQSVRVILAPGNLGYPGGVNACLRAAPDADAWWVLNPDTEPYPGAMAALVARLAAGDCDAAGGTLVRPDGSLQSHGGLWRGWLARAVSLGIGRPASDTPDPAVIEATQTYLSGASMMVGRRFLDAVGPMPDAYFIYCEEVEWCLRARARGMTLGFAPGARVLHHHGTTTGSGRDALRRPRLPVFLEERNRLLVTRDCFPGRMPVVAVAALALLMARYARRGAWKQVGYGLEGWYAGLRGRRGAPRFLAP